MKIINDEKILKNNQITRILKLSKFKSDTNITIIILNDKKDIFKRNYRKHMLQWLFSFNCEGNIIIKSNIYLIKSNNCLIKLYNLSGNIEDKRLYGIGVILHELCHYYEEKDEDKCDNYVIDFLNTNSRFIKDVLNLTKEWKIEEF